MSAIAVTSTVSRRRIWRARAWLESRMQAEEVLVVGATLDAANELARGVAKENGAAFGWHRLTLPQVAAAVAAPLLATRGLVPLSRLGTEAVVARLVHRMRAEGALSHYDAVAGTPGFPRAIAGVITELRMAKLPPAAVGGVAPDLARMIGAYEADLLDAGLTDWAGRAGARDGGRERPEPTSPDWPSYSDAGRAGQPFRVCGRVIFIEVSIFEQGQPKASVVYRLSSAFSAA